MTRALINGSIMLRISTYSGDAFVSHVYIYAKQQRSEIATFRWGRSMKVFLSWSGDVSRAVACVFRDWLPSVIQTVHPYVSSEDIDKGARWATDIAQELESASFGILFITKDNVEAPWVNFEAGALSKTIDKSRVAPFLFNVKRSEIKEGPLLQFQSTVNERQDLEKLVVSINNSLPDDERLDEVRLKKCISVWWPDLTRQLEIISAEIPSSSDSTPELREPTDLALLEEILELTRSQHKLLRAPEMLLPPEYLRSVARIVSDRNLSDEPALRETVKDLAFRWDALQSVVYSLLHSDNKDNTSLREMLSAVRTVDTPIKWLCDRMNIEPVAVTRFLHPSRISDRELAEAEEAFRRSRQVAKDERQE